MAKQTGVPVTPKKAAALRTAAKTSHKNAPARKSRSRASRKAEAGAPAPLQEQDESLISETRPHPRVGRKLKPPSPPAKGNQVEPSISEAQTRVGAAKFEGSQIPPKGTPRPSLPATYGENHVLLLVRDPQTLFAAWDMSPAVVEELRARIGRRAFAVSTLTLRVIRAGGRASVHHVGRRARSRYLRIDGGPSFIAEIGFTTPAGRFEFIARSAPCFVPVAAGARATLGKGDRSFIRYREARGLALKGLLPLPRRRDAPETSAGSKDATEAPWAAPNLQVARVLGGASDLYRR